MLSSLSVVSLKSPENADPDKRRVIAAATAAVAAPSNTAALADREKAGWATGGRRWLHILVKVNTSGSIDWQLWRFNHLSSLWTLDTRIGTAGTESLAFADADNPQGTIVEIDGADRVAIRLLNPVGLGSVDVWLGAAGGVD